MDIKRTILIAALAIVSYVMVLKWNQDYGQAALPTQNAAASNVAPSVPSLNGNANSDIPSLNAETSPAEVAPVVVSKDLIRVKTDVLDLAIDPTGGDIAQLTLPKYPRRQDHPEIPFQLFDNGNERVYLAQSNRSVPTVRIRAPRVARCTPPNRKVINWQTVRINWLLT